MKLENRYIVVKRQDISYLNTEQKEIFRQLLLQIVGGRAVDGKPHHGYLCISDDWPEYEPTLKLLSERVDKEESENDNPRKPA